MCVEALLALLFLLKYVLGHRSISGEMKKQVMDEFGEVPKDKKLINCVGGGSSAQVFGMNGLIMIILTHWGRSWGPEGSSKHAAPLTNDHPSGFFMEQLNMLFKTIRGKLKNRVNQVLDLITQV